MSDVVISKKNEVYIKLQCEPHILYELQPYFTFDVPNAKFAPAYKNKYWDGKIRLLSIQSGEIYMGLLDKVIEKLKAHNYTYKFEENKFYGLPFEVNESISLEGVKDYITSISSHTPRNYQIDGIYDALRHNRKLLISPTGSGKSLMIYSIVRYYVEKGEKILLITPTTSLVEQMYKDFMSYGWDSESYCHKIYAGRDKNPLWVYVTTEDGIEYKFEGNQYINLINNKKKLAKNLTEDDEIDDRWLSAFKK